MSIHVSKGYAAAIVRVDNVLTISYTTVIVTFSSPPTCMNLHCHPCIFYLTRYTYIFRLGSNVNCTI